TPSIFYYNAICVIPDGIDATASSVSAPLSRYLAWKAPETLVQTTILDKQLEIAAEPSASYGMTDLQVLTQYMFNKETLVKLIRYCTVFEQEEVKNKETGLISQVKIKKVAAYHQYYAVQ